MSQKIYYADFVGSSAENLALIDGFRFQNAPP